LKLLHILNKFVSSLIRVKHNKHLGHTCIFGHLVLGCHYGLYHFWQTSKLWVMFSYVFCINGQYTCSKSC